MKRSKVVELSAGGSYRLKKLNARQITEAGPLLAGLAEAFEAGDAAVQRYSLENLGDFIPLVAGAIIEEDGEPTTLTEDEVGDMDSEDFIELVAALDYGMEGGSATARRGFPVDGRPASVGEGGSDDPHRS